MSLWASFALRLLAAGQNLWHGTWHYSQPQDRSPMLVRVNKRIPTRKPVKYSALSSGTISHVWSDDAFEESMREKRRNLIRLTRDTTPIPTPKYDA